MFMYWKFKLLRQKQIDMEINLETTSRSEHVQEYEQQSRVLTERLHAYHCTLPLKNITKLILEYMVKHSELWVNYFLPKVIVPRIVRINEFITGININ